MKKNFSIQIRFENIQWEIRKFFYFIPIKCYYPKLLFPSKFHKIQRYCLQANLIKSIDQSSSKG